jgi:hypothetical protein
VGRNTSAEGRAGGAAPGRGGAGGGRAVDGGTAGGVGGAERVREREEVRERLARARGGLDEDVEAMDDDRAERALLDRGQVRDAQRAEARLGVLRREGSARGGEGREAGGERASGGGRGRRRRRRRGAPTPRAWAIRARRRARVPTSPMGAASTSDALASATTVVDDMLGRAEPPAGASAGGRTLRARGRVLGEPRRPSSRGARRGRLLYVSQQRHRYL